MKTNTMKTLRLIFATALATIGLAAASAYGTITTFDFSYQFPAIANYQPEMTVWGTLTGNLSSDGFSVENVSLVSIFFDTIQAPGQYVVAANSVVSFNPEGNNFFSATLPKCPGTSIPGASSSNQTQVECQVPFPSTTTVTISANIMETR